MYRWGFPERDVSSRDTRFQQASSLTLNGSNQRTPPGFVHQRGAARSKRFQPCDETRIPFHQTCIDTVFNVGQYPIEASSRVHIIAGWTTMVNPTQSRDVLLVKECLSGSEEAWTQFYTRYVGLVRSMVKRQLGWGVWDLEDVTQSVFAALIPALRNYDEAYSLSRFICVIAERVCIQEYRQSRAAKRAAQSDSIDHLEGREQGARDLHSEADSPEQQLSRRELIEILRRAMSSLNSECRELLKLRYFDELPYKEIAQILKASENTLTVRARRCLGELTSNYYEILRRGHRQ
ncbi:MAG: sigma-70 family RNA polymerase sigma factor [Deltaproteobacteria bacterium]|nr:sigma-70 family RNA polymerase sigma factor [Deltaproteobacteria bacterium]